jgi:hypothetical protein
MTTETVDRDPQAAVVAAIRTWSRLTDLASFAVARHGFGDTNSGFGVTYPGDLDEYDRAVEGATIPDGFVEVYGHWGPPDGYSLLIRESMYLNILASVFVAEGLHSEAAKVEVLRQSQQDV